MEQKLQEHDTTLLRLESVATKNAENIASMKTQMENQMNEIIRSIQALSNNQGQQAQVQQIVSPYHNSNNRLTKMEFPKFNGENIEGWMCRVEHLFDIDATPENLKVKFVIVHLEDIALLCHQSLVKSRGGSIEGMLWNEYKGFILARFGMGLNQYAMGALVDLRQTGSLSEFCKEFDLALTRVNICGEYAVSLFLRAIKPEIGNPFKLIRPRNLPKAYMLARIQEDDNASYNRYSKPFKTSFSSINKPTGGPNIPLLPAPLPKPKPMSARRLSHKEIEEKRAKGECFGCNEKYTPNHVCKNKQLFSIEIIDIDCNDENTLHEMVMNPFQDQEPCISLNAIMRVPSYSTMRVIGAIGTKPLQILIDSGSTHNFLNLELALRMRYPIKEVAELNITVADGNKTSCTQLCENFKWMMQGNWFSTDVMLVPLSNYDMVLGVQWLQTLDDINWNFKQLTMKFKMNVLLSDPKGIASTQLYSLQTLDGDIFQHETRVVQNNENEALNSLLKKYDDVFVVPTVLPPKRNCDHKILLKDESIAINQRAYGYPAHQKKM
ncbi:uncharacterized protein LOC110892882 [Helianthus annuus]|uniref:uncharacterized protein LOC110892882 n=1 Tax=Helianthus annuus TaxID=4232 RepID=UPI001652C31A|nr:uncharacterized protein LOC110892882 [Helianthus annuus]